MEPNPEIGLELKAADLKPATVYVLHKECAHKPAITAWYMGPFAEPALLDFFMAEVKMHLLLRVKPDGTLCDNTDTQIHVYEYLGEV